MMDLKNELLPMDNSKAALAQAAIKAKELYKFVTSKNKALKFNGKRYMYFTEWQTLGNWYRVDVETEIVGPVELFGDKGIKARAVATHTPTGNIVGKGEAMCFKSEKGKSGHSWNQIASMAQTRAGSKAFRNALGWVVELSQLSSTPAEEMQEFIDGEKKKTEKTEPKHEEEKAGKKPPKTKIEEEAEKNGVVDVETENNKKEAAKRKEEKAKKEAEDKAKIESISKGVKLKEMDAQELVAHLRGQLEMAGETVTGQRLIRDLMTMQRNKVITGKQRVAAQKYVRENKS